MGYPKKTPEQIRRITLQNSEKRREIKRKAIEYKGGACYKCGYNECVAALTFHHLDPSKKDFQISSNSIRNWKTIEAELDKCILVCQNCHCKIHHDERQPTLKIQEEELRLLESKIKRGKRRRDFTCDFCNAPMKKYKSWETKNNFCSRDCKVKYFNIGWPSDDEILNMYEKYGAKQLAKNLNRSLSAVYVKVRRIKKEKYGSKNARPAQRKVVRPSKEELQKLLWEMSLTKIGKKFGLSDKAISKWVSAYELELPPKGYWARKQ